MKALVWLFVGTIAVSAQTLTIARVQTSRGAEFQVEISMASPSGKAPTILKWDTIFPAQLLDVVGSGPEVGRAGKDSGKSIACTMQKPYSYTCILFGGLKPVENGVIAIIRFKAHADVAPGKMMIRTQKADAAMLDSKRFNLDDAEGSVEIR